MRHFEPADILIQRLQLIADLNDDDRDAVRALRFETRTLQVDVDIVRDGDVLDRCCLIIDGTTARYRMMENGKRQIVAFHITGDIPDLQSLHIKKISHSLATLSPSEVAMVSHKDIWAACLDRPRLNAALWLETLIDAAIYREWIISLGQYSALDRTARLLCELIYRMKGMGLGRGEEFFIPLTQSDFAEALGLTVVSVNRAFQKLQRDQIVSRERARIVVRNWERLAAIGKFDPDYLHIRSRKSPEWEPVPSPLMAAQAR